ncbi:MAG: GAF domain-containing protein, partial [Anaerolineae bacterium]|nr:GAF domain-containing protein [Anaerolineae bacterium]
MALLLLVLYGWLAVSWQAQPFLGVILSPRFYVDNVVQMSTASWPGHDAGLLTGDRLYALDDVVLDADYRVAAQQVEAVVKAATVGDSMTVSVIRSPDGPEPPDMLSCVPATADMPGPAGGQLCTATVTLVAYPLVDFIMQFGVSFVVALALLGTAGALLRLRWDSANARRVAIFSLAMAVAVAGAFDALYTTFALIPVFLGALLLAGGAMLALALHFPLDLIGMQRRSWLRWLPVSVTVLALLGMAALMPLSSRDFFWPSWYLTIVYLLVAAAVLIAALVIRLRRTASPAVRDQSAVGVVSALLTVLPFVLWIISDQLQSVPLMAALAFPFSLVTPFLLGISVGFSYALWQHRLPDSDTVLSQGAVYGILVVAITVGYGLLVTGFSLLGGSVLPADNPLLLAAAVFVLALLFVPVRNALERRIDQAYFRTRRLYQRRVEYLAQTLTRLSSLTGIAEAVRAQLNETLLPTHAFLFFLEQETGQYLARGTGRLETDVRFAQGSPLVDLLAEQHRPLYLTEADPQASITERSRLAVLGAVVLVPLIGQNQVSGILAVGPRRSGQRYQHDDLGFMQNLADQAALAVERAQVIDNLQQRVNELNVLGQVAQAVNYTIEFDDLLELIYAQTNRVIIAPNFYIALRDPNTDELFFAFYTENDERITAREGRRWRMGRDLLSDIVRTGQPMRVEDYGAEIARRGGQTPLENDALRAWMGVPLNA